MIQGKRFWILVLKISDCSSMIMKLDTNDLIPRT